MELAIPSERSGSPLSFTSVSPTSSRPSIESSVEPLRTPTVSADKLHIIGVGPTMWGFMFKLCSALTNSADIGFDIYAATRFIQKENICSDNENSSKFNILNNTNSINTNSARDVLDIQLNYQTYGILTIILLLIPSWIQSVWSYYMFWMEDKSNICQCIVMAT